MDWLLGPQAYDALALGAWSSQYYLVPLLAAAALALVFLGPKLSRSRPGHANRAEVRKGSDDSSSQEVSETEEDDEVQAKPPKARRRGVDEEAGRGGMRDRRYNGLRLVDWNGIQIPFNEIMSFETEFFKGQVLFMMKTQPEDPKYGAHFHGKQRLFEMQIQGEFKKLPSGVLYMGAELTEPMQLGLVTKAVAGMVLSFSKRLIKNLHYSFGESGKAVEGADEIELPHVTFPLLRGMDRLIISKPGDTPPALGQELVETEEQRLARRGGKGEEPKFELGVTYTMGFHSMYIDFVNWQLVNVAGQKSIDLANYFGESSVHIVVYDLDPAVASSKHRKQDKRYFYHCELVNSNLNQDEADGKPEGKDAVALLLDEGDGGPGGFVRSGDVIPLYASGEGGPWGAVTESDKGYCVLKTGGGAQAVEAQVVKVGGTSAYYRSDFLCNGDVVVFRCVHSGKYLSVYKGWYLYWTSSPPSSSSSRAHLVVGGLDEAERLTAGRAFSLRSSKWGTYEVGVGGGEGGASDYGERPLGLYQTSKKSRVFQSKKSKTWLQPVLFKAPTVKDAEGRASITTRPEGLSVGIPLVDLSHAAAEEGPSGSHSPSREREEEEKVDVPLGAFVEQEAVITPDDVEQGLEVDVAGWLEMVHRRKRKAQLCYVLRVRFRHKPDVTWFALRTGTDLAPVIQMQRERAADGAGMSAKSDIASSSSQYILQRGSSTAHKNASSKRPDPAGVRLRPLQHQSPADQSTRLLAQLLWDITAARPGSLASVTAGGSREDPPSPPSCKAALHSILKRRNHLDVWWLSGGQAADLGVSLPSRPAPVLQTVASRALWDTHWKEEWMVLYPSHMSSFTPGGKKASWSLLLSDLLAVKVPSERSRTPYLGKAVLVLETLGRVHYVCFPSEAVRDSWMLQIQSRTNQGGEVPAGVLLSDPREAFVLKSGQWRPSSRLILNARRLSFDLNHSALVGVTPSQMSERALRMVYGLSPDSTTERLVAFLDLCSLFKAIPLHALDLASDEALAFFLNTYHTLLQHALLLLGPPSSKDWASFFQSVSYEIGSDVFSLNELEHCVLRGKLSRPRAQPRNFPSVPPTDDNHYQYALGRPDYRLSLALTTGSCSGPPFVTVFKAHNVDDQLDNACVRYIDWGLKLDAKKRVILLPKVCDLYRTDFEAEDRADLVKVCLRYLDRAKRERVSWLMAGASKPQVKYMPLKSKMHPSLMVIEDRG